MSIVLHGDSRVVKHGGRNIPRMSEDEFFERLQRFMGAEEEIDDPWEAVEMLFDFLVMDDGFTNTLYKDFKGFVFTGSYTYRAYSGEMETNTETNELHFNMENYIAEVNEVDGCPYILVHTCGGDYQIPFCFMIYHDGKTVRVFVPTYGNNWIPFTKGGAKCKGLIGEYSADLGYEYGGDIDWKPILKAMGKIYDNRIIQETVKRASKEYRYPNSDPFIRNYGFDPAEIDEQFEDFRAYCKTRATELLPILRSKGTVTGLNKVDDYILRQMTEVIFEYLREDVEDADVDDCVYEFESRVDPYDL